MRRILLLLQLLALTACTRYQGPREVYQNNREKSRSGDRVDSPYYSIDEQEKRGRARLSLFEDDFRVGPKTYADSPGGVGR